MASNNKAFLKGLILLAVCVLLSYTIGVVIGMTATADSRQIEIAELQEQLTKCEQEHGLCVWQTEAVLSENQGLWESNTRCQEAIVLWERYAAELEMENYACLWLLERLWEDK